ncbi:glyoxal oxidase N-terminus-domain-containing protein [Epithele typhae]|uniref:glyoxal oxidase N-terminus-domain-containing protein n=1 Tax=Epithele typhae TaxID=378194 RepID=UPI002007BB74|nr:glyoxal oxidase N-terminus-domain-containing protein [Epithele typhae]KAH9914171.1 glyoxal oxidase N-terminus-domain-containing protein [Epithele typhae]
MSHRQLSLLALSLAAATSALDSHSAGSFENGGNTQVSAMMMFLGNLDKVYILDKSEANSATFNGYPAMGSVYDIATRTATTMGVTTNVFCASGLHLPNGSFVTFGGNGAVGPGGNIGDTTPPGNPYTATFDTKFGDYDGTKAIRILKPCTSSDDFTSPDCQWFDNATQLSMQGQRWYSTAEARGDGSIAIIGGFTNGGYINRNTPNTDPAYEGGAANPTYEFFPAKGEAQVMQFMIKTSGLNAYPHTYLMPSGKMLVQANYSTMLWDPDTNTETDLPDMPDQIVRVYPASGATAMLPLTPENNWTPTVIFCGGVLMTDEQWGNYSWPWADTWTIPASNKCHTITPEPTDGSTVDYVEVDPMLETRTMGQFIALPDLTMLVVNGGENGTAGYSTRTLNTLQMPFGQSLSSGPAGTPAIFNPRAAAGKQWTNAGFDTSSIARLYHSSAILLPDGSVLIAGSNPNVDVNTTTVFPTTYEAEIFYPSYFSASNRPTFTGAPSTLTYGGKYFDLTVPASAYSGSANDAADNTSVVLVRGGWTTHAMNMGQRVMQLNNTYTVNSDGSITLHVSQLPPNPNLFQPGPTLMFVTMSGIPSNATWVTVGSGNIETQPTSNAVVLPSSVRLDGAKGNGSNTTTTGNNKSDASHTGVLVGGIIAAIAAVGILGASFGICAARRRREVARQASERSYPMSTASGGAAGVTGARAGGPGFRGSDSSAFIPLSQGNESHAWAPNASQLSLQTPSSPYFDDMRTHSSEFDPYHQNAPRVSNASARPGRL